MFVDCFGDDAGFGNFCDGVVDQGGVLFLKRVEIRITGGKSAAPGLVRGNQLLHHFLVVVQTRSHKVLDVLTEASFDVLACFVEDEVFENAVAYAFE